MSVHVLRSHPVKSMLGVDVDEVTFGPGGVDGDRALALLDVDTGRVASAKQPRLWRPLLQCSAVSSTDGVTITLPDGRKVAAADADGPLSELLGRAVRVSSQRPAGVEVERPDPDDVLAHGVDADVEYALLEIAQGTPGGTFVDHSPVHLITTATLDHLGVEALRYRPNLVLATPPGTPPFVENEWLGRELTVGAARLRLTLPTPRCALPTLEHGDLPRARRPRPVGTEPRRRPRVRGAALRRGVRRGRHRRDRPHRGRRRDRLIAAGRTPSLSRQQPRAVGSDHSGGLQR